MKYRAVGVGGKSRKLVRGHTPSTPTDYLEKRKSVKVF